MNVRGLPFLADFDDVAALFRLLRAMFLAAAVRRR